MDTKQPRLRIRPGTLVLLALVLVGLTLLSGEARVVAAPLCATLLCTWWFYAGLERRGDPAPVADIGAWYVAAVSVYALIPVLVYLALGMQYTLLNDNRAFVLQPPPGEIARVAWMYFVHLTAFCLAYIATHGKRLPPPPRVTAIPSAVLSVSLTALVLIWAVTALFGPGGEAPTSYTEGYIRLASLPLGVRQVLRLISGVELVLTLVVLVALFQRYDRYKWLIWGYLAYRFYATILLVGSRTALAVPAVICLVLYHVMVRPFRRRTAITLATVGLAAFMALGVLRAFQAFVSSGTFTTGMNGGEFEALYTNAVDLDLRAKAGQLGEIPLSFSVADLVSPIPSQMLPFQKVDLSVWYLDRFYPEAIESGGGLGFGLIAQSIIGFGWIDLVARGAVLGFIFGRIHKYYRRHGSQFWVTVFYVWVVLWAYQSFRNSTFALLPFVFQWLFPTIIAVEVTRAFFLAGFERRRPLDPQRVPTLGAAPSS